MRQLLPSCVDDVTPYDVYRVEPGAGCIRINMVSSIDGRITDEEGRSGGLAGDGDFDDFRALRALADGILVGAGTARLEGYGPHRMPAWLAERRRGDGRPDPAPIILVSRSLRLDVSTPLFAETVTPTVVMTSEKSAAEASAELQRRAHLVVAGGEEVDLAAGLQMLADEHGIHHVLCEGGPSLNTALLATGLVTELCITIAPLLTGSDARGIVSPPARGSALELLSVCEQDGELYARYALRADDGQ